MENKELIWLPKDLVEKLKKVVNEEELIEKEVLCYIEKTKKNISNQVELLDEDVLLFKGKLASYKKAFREAYESADSEMYSFWEELDGKLADRYKAMKKRLDGITAIYNREFEARKTQIEHLSKKMENINTYQFEKMISFLKQYQSLDQGTRDLFDSMLKEASHE